MYTSATLAVHKHARTSVLCTQDTVAKLWVVLLVALEFRIPAPSFIYVHICKMKMQICIKWIHNFFSSTCQTLSLFGGGGGVVVLQNENIQHHVNIKMVQFWNIKCELRCTIYCKRHFLGIIVMAIGAYRKLWIHSCHGKTNI